MITSPITQYATALVGRRTPIRCQRMRGRTGGYTIQVVGGKFLPTIHLSNGICRSLDALERGQRTPRTAQAALTLTHEAYHIILNSPNEARVECAAIRAISTTLRLYRADTPRMRRWSWELHRAAAPLYGISTCTPTPQERRKL